MTVQFKWPYVDLLIIPPSFNYNLNFHLVGVLGEIAPLCWNWYYASQLEADSPGCNTAGVEGLGWPGSVECGLLPDPQGHRSGRHVSQGQR